MSACRIILALGVSLAALGVGTAVGQQPGPPGLNAPPPQMAPVVPDTIDIAITTPDSLPQPEAVFVVQDTLVFGGLLNLVCDYAADQVDGPDLQVMAEGDWLVPVPAVQPGFFARLLGRASAPTVDYPGLPAAAGLRVVRSFRVYRRDPLRIRWGDQRSPVLTVVGQAVGLEQTASIRGPRDQRWIPWLLILIALACLIIVWLARRLWLRRHAPPPLAHWPVPAPAWLAFAVDLQELLADGALARGETRLFLDRLAALARTYVAGRYRIAAREMTGDEIVSACESLGHATAHPVGFARLIDRTDQRRYDPTAPDPAFCREQAVQLLGRVNRVRLDPKYLAIAPARQLAGEKAWSVLAGDLGLGAGRVAQTSGGEVR